MCVSEADDSVVMLWLGLDVVREETLGLSDFRCDQSADSPKIDNPTSATAPPTNDQNLVR